MINIAYVLTPIEFGGSERVSLNLIKACDRTQFDITPVLLLRPWEPKPFFAGELDKLGIEYLTIPVAIQPLEAGKDRFRILRCYRILFSYLKEKKFDLIHTNGYFADILGVPLAKCLRIPHVATCHGFIDNDQNLKLYNRLDMFFLRFSNRVICVADEIKEKLIQSGISAHKISTLINSVSVPEYSSDERLKIKETTRKNWGISKARFVLGYTGRLSEEKGLRFLFEAVGQLVEKDSELTVFLVGDGSQRNFLEVMAKDLHLQDHVVFAGFQKDVTRFLPAFDVFVLPSLTEGTPMAMLEAMSFGVPVVATKVGGIPKVITHGITGVLISPSNVSEIVSSIISLKKDEEYRDSLSLGARELIEKHYSLDAQVEKVEALYRSLL
ncbi:glycosyltransferase [bacterium]|nr:glycosyltransferase [bacterium]